MMMRALLRVILFLFSLEVFLRVSGFVSLTVQDYQNRSHFKGQHVYTILCVGESVTMGGTTRIQGNWKRSSTRKNLSKKFSGHQ